MDEELVHPTTGPQAPYARQPFTSYSLNFEDVRLHRAFAGRERGFYVDVGAGHPRFENDTCALHERGWTGINLEPNESFIAAFREARPGDLNLCLALSDAEGELLYYEVVGTGLSTFDAAQAQLHAARGHKIRSRRVAVTTLAHVLELAGSPAVDLLKVDVEGYEERVLAGNDWSWCRPRIIIVEATYPERPERRPTGVRVFLEGKGYRHVLFDGLNDFYAEKDFRLPDNFALPPCVFDGFVMREVVDFREEVDSLRKHFKAAEDYGRSLQEYAKSLQESERQLQSQVAALEAIATALLRGLRPSDLRILPADDPAQVMPSCNTVQTMDKVSETGSEVGTVNNADLEGRLAAAQIDGLRAENRRLALDLEDMVQENHRLRAATEQMRAEILVLSRSLEPLHRINEEIARFHEADRWRERLQATYASTSWRLTRPIRGLMRLLRRQKGPDWPESLR